MPTLNSREEKARELNYALKILFLRRESDNLCSVTNRNRWKYISDLFFLQIINSKASKSYPFEISLINIVKKFIFCNSNKKRCEINYS